MTHSPPWNFRRNSKAHPQPTGLRVICFSSFVEPELVAQGLDIGAWGYIEKVDELEVVFEAVRAVARGQMAFSQETAAVARALRPEVVPLTPTSPLTEIESQVVRRIAGGVAVLEIARELGQRRCTIRAVLDRAQEKLGILPEERGRCLPRR